MCDFSEMGSMTCDQSLLMPKAAVNYQQNVLNAWQKIDDALSACAAEQHQAQHLQARPDLAASEWRLGTRFVMINKVIDNVSLPRDSMAK